MEKNKLVKVLMGALGLAAGVGAVVLIKKKGKNSESEVEAVETDIIESENNDEE